MPQSLARVPIQLVFSTKNREPVLTQDLDQRLHSYLAGILKSEGHTPIKVGGFDDHVHLLYGLSRTQTISKSVEVVKAGSLVWLRSQGLENFYWQNGYGAFGISESNVPEVVRYIENQREHHKTISYQDELRQLLIEHKIEFDERYLWD